MRMKHLAFHSRLGRAIVIAATVAALAPHADADEATDQFNVASGFFKMDRFDFAAEEYEKFLKDSPKHEQAHEALFFLGESYYHLKKYDEARGRFRQVVAQHPNSRNYFNALYRSGEISSLLGDLKSAEPALTEFVAKRPDDPVLEFALPDLGRVQLRASKQKEAKATLQKALEKFPKGRLADQAQYDLAQASEQLGEKDAAIQLYRTLAANNASKLADDAQLALGSRYFEDKNFDAATQAFQDLEKRFASSPWVAAARLNRALCLYQLKRFDQAQVLLEAQIRGESADVPEAWYWLGMTQRARGQHEAAAKSLLDGFAKFADTPTATEMLYYAAQALLAQGQHAAAIDRFLEVVAKFAKHELADDAQFYAVESARASGQHERVLVLAAQFTKQFPQSPLAAPTTLAVGQSLIALGRNDVAARQLGDLLARKPEPAIAVPAQYYRAVALHALGKLDETLAALAALVADPPPAAPDATAAGILVDAQFLTGSSHFEKKDYAKAVGPLQKYLAARPAGDVAGYAVSYLAVSHAALGQFEQLRGTLDTLRAKAAKDLSLPALFRVAEACYEAKQFALAADLYTEVTQKDPQGNLHAKSLSGLGWSRFQENKFSAAAQAFTQVVEQHAADPLAGEAAYMRGRALESDSKLAESVAAYETALNKYGQSPQAFDAGLQLARAQQKLKKNAEAIAAYEDLAKRFPQAKQFDVVLFEWAWALELNQKSAEAQKIFERLATQFPASPLMQDAVLNVCESLFQAKQFTDVVARLKPLVAKELPPKVREPALYRLARTQVELAAWPDAAATFGLLAKEFPQSTLRREADFWIAESDRQQSQPKAAAERLAKLIAEQVPPEPWLGTAYLRLAQSQGEQKQWKEMLATVEQLKKRFPKYELLNVAEYHAGRALQNLARFDEARDAYRRAIAGRADENAAQAQFMVGETFFHQKRFQEALREFLKVEILYAFPQWQAAALLEAGKCYESLQEWSRAVETYNRILEKYAKTSHSEEAAARKTAALQKVSAGASKSKGTP